MRAKDLRGALHRWRRSTLGTAHRSTGNAGSSPRSRPWRSARGQRRLMLSVSNDTLLRVVRRRGCPPSPAPTVIRSTTCFPAPGSIPRPPKQRSKRTTSPEPPEQTTFETCYIEDRRHPALWGGITAYAEFAVGGGLPQWCSTVAFVADAGLPGIAARRDGVGNTPTARRQSQCRHISPRAVSQNHRTVDDDRPQ